MIPNKDLLLQFSYRVLTGEGLSDTEKTDLRELEDDLTTQIGELEEALVVLRKIQDFTKE